MDIVISGTKFGWGYFTDKQPSGLFDIGTGAGMKALTQQAYAIGYKDNNFIFTKYRIIKDVRGDKRIGFVAFSLFLPFDKKLSGSTIKTILDRVENEYCQKYIPDGKNLEDVRENFNFLDTISAEYNKDITNYSVFNEDIQSGTTEAAIIYYPYIYKDWQTQKEIKFELEDIFEEPFQEEYIPYRQILFISNDLKGKDKNPLVALQHSENDLTGKVDLKNEYFLLNNYNRSKGVRISAWYNNKWNECSDIKRENQIRSKWTVKIEFTKGYYEPIVAKGSISNPDSDIYKYLEINENNKSIKIKYDAFRPDPKTKIVTFNVVTKKDHANVTDAEIQVDNQPWQCRSEVTFTGEELGREHKIAARKGDNLFSDVVKITPKDYSESLIPFQLQLIEKRVVKITATDQENGDAIWQFKVHITGKDFYKITDQIEFIGDEIDKEWNIQIEKRPEYVDSENRKFCPAKDGEEISFKLKKAKKKRNIIDIPGHSDSDSDDNKDEKKSFAAKVKSFFSKPAVIATSIVSALVFGLGIWALCYSLGNDKQPKKNLLTTKRITAYIEGDSLMLNKLNNYEENWKSQEQNFITKSGGRFFGGVENIDSTEWTGDWKPTYKNIEQAITKRNLINQKSFKKLKKLSYSAEQQSFKTAIKKIDSTEYTEVGQKLSDVSALTLTQIADSINAVLNSIKQEEREKLALPKEQKKEEIGKVQKDEHRYMIMYLKTSSDFDLTRISKYYSVRGLSTDLNNGLRLVKDFIDSGYVHCKTFKVKASSDKFLKKNKNIEKWVDGVCNDSQTGASTDNTSAIIKYIKGSELNKSKLKEYKKAKGINNNLKRSIQLCLDFWALDGNGSGKNAKTYWTFLKKVKKDKYLQESKLIAFLDEMCKEEASPSYSTIDKKKGLK